MATKMGQSCALPLSLLRILSGSFIAATRNRWRVWLRDVLQGDVCLLLLASGGMDLQEGRRAPSRAAEHRRTVHRR